MTENCAIWARVSTSDQHTANQLDHLRQIAKARGFVVKAEFVTEDSAWQASGGNGKGTEYDRARAALIAGAHRGDYSVVLVWAFDRLSRRGYRDLDGLLRQLAADGCAVWSDQEPWLTNLGPMGEIALHMLAWVAEHESARRSERIKAGLARKAARGEPIGGAPGRKDTKPRRRSGYVAMWEPGGSRRASD